MRNATRNSRYSPKTDLARGEAVNRRNVVRDLQGGELVVEGGLVSFELRGVVLGCLAAGRAALLFLPRAVPHRAAGARGVAAWRAPAGRNGSGDLPWRGVGRRRGFCRGNFGMDDGMGTGARRLESSTTAEWARAASSVRRRDFWVVLIASDRKRNGGCSQYKLYSTGQRSAVTTVHRPILVDTVRKPYCFFHVHFEEN